MDSVVDSVGQEILKNLHLTGVSLITVFVLLSMICQMITRIIPDDATGWKCVVRKICAVIGLYVAHRVTSGVSTADVARDVMTRRQPYEDRSEVHQADE
jgi:hypothetical protein